MEQKKKNLLEMRKLGFSQKTLSLMTESQVAMILEKIKKKETKEAEQDIETKTTLNANDKFKEVTVAQIQQLSKLGNKPLVKKEKVTNFDTTSASSKKFTTC